MSGLKTNLNKEQIAAATGSPPMGGDFVWDGKDEDDRPLSKKEMREGIKRAGGRPKLANPKKQLTIRLNNEVIEFFKSQGKGWQTKINDALQEYVKTHKVA